MSIEINHRRQVEVEAQRGQIVGDALRVAVGFRWLIQLAELLV